MKRDIYYFSGTHWDREWYQTFQGFRYRLVRALNDVCKAWEKMPEFGVFHLDGQTIPLEDYAEIEPETAQKIKSLIEEGKIKIGPWYVMPDEFNISGESFIRNLMMGHELSKKWGAEDAWKFGYICDIFGHIAQTPQIFQGFGINYSLFSRGYFSDTEPYFIWRSPDGSEVLNMRMGNRSGYGEFAVQVTDKGKMNRSVEEAREDLEEYIPFLLSTTKFPVHIVMDALDHRPLRPETSDYIKAIQEICPEAEIHHTDLIEAGKHLEQYRDELDVVTGEMNNANRGGFPDLITNVLSSYYPLKQANDICQNRLEKVIEPFMAFASMAKKPFNRNYVKEAYRYLIQNHPHDSIGGCSIDQVHKDMEYRYDQTKEICDVLESEYIRMNSVGGGYEVGKESDGLVTLFNPLPFEREEVITVPLYMKPEFATTYCDQPFGFETVNSFHILDENGNEIPYQLKSVRNGQVHRLYDQIWQSTNVYTVSFMAKTPAGGRSSYRIVPSVKPSRYLKHLTSGRDYMENEYIRVDIDPCGSITLTDRKTGKVYLNQLILADDSEIGDGWYHANAREDRTVYSAAGKCRIEKVESGAVRCVFRITKEMEVPKELVLNHESQYRSSEYETCTAVFEVGLSEGARFADVHMTYDNRVKNHRVRLMIPTYTEGDTYFADQPFYCCTRKVGIDYETQNQREYDQYEKSMNGVTGKRDKDGNGLVFISAEGLHEVASTDDSEATLYVTLLRGFRKTVMTNGETRGQILGTHSYSFLLAPVDKTVTFADIIKQKSVMGAGVLSAYTEIGKEEAVPQSVSECKLEGEGIILSILKCAEREDGVVARVYNASDEESNAKLTFKNEILSAKFVNLNEEEIADNALKTNDREIAFSVKPWQIKTVLIKM